MNTSTAKAKTRSQLSWLKSFFKYLVKMALFHTLILLRLLPKLFFFFCFWKVPRKSFKVEAVNPEQIEKAVELFKRDGFVVINNALLPDEVKSLKKLVYDKAEEMVRADELGQLPAQCKHGKNRYSYGDYQHQSNWEYLAHNKNILPIIEAIWKDHDFAAISVGGDFVLPGGEYQPLHTDMGWTAAGGPAKILTVNYYVIDVNFENGPIRQIPGTQNFPAPSPNIIANETEWMKKCLVIAPAGTAIIRDPRAWHGGTPNVSAHTRCMPNCGYVRDDVGLKDVGGGGAFKRLSQNQFVHKFKNSKK